MVDIDEKEKLYVDTLISKLQTNGKLEMDSLSQKEFKLDTFHKQAIGMGMIQQPPTEFMSKYNILKEFLMTKRFEGCSDQTLKIYYSTLFNYISSLDDGISLLDTKSVDIRRYLMKYQEEHQCSNLTLDNMRRIFSSFFTWLESEDYAIKNPIKKLKKIKTETVVKKPFTEEEFESIKDACKNYRELALVEFLYATGVRVGELCSLDILDLDFTNREAIVCGKGNKERVIYFDVKSKVHLLRYLDTRIDTNPALFVKKKYPFNRLTKSGVESILKVIGNRAGVEKCHPHRFRRTFATNLLDRGVPIEQVQIMLGHSKIDTTLLYASVNNQSVKINHNRYI